MSVYKREGGTPQEAWNELIRQINDLAENPDSGCQAIAPLPEVTEDHRWSKTDITQAQDKLKEICSENDFTEPPDLWKQSIIDELTAAIENGWCDCEANLEIAIGPKFLSAGGSNTVQNIDAYLDLIADAEADNTTQRQAAFATFQKRQELAALIASGTATPAQIAAKQAEVDALAETENDLMDDLDDLLDTIYTEAAAIVFLIGASTFQYTNIAQFLNDISVPIGDQVNQFVKERWGLESDIEGDFEFLFGQNDATKMHIVRSGRLIPPHSILFSLEGQFPILNGYPVLRRPGQNCGPVPHPACIRLFVALPDFYNFRVIRFSNTGQRLDFN